MAEIVRSRKNLVLNPLKMSPPLGATLAFMGIAGTVPLLHGSQGCTAFAKVLKVRHFREPSPIQTTAMNEVTTILGGLDNLEQGCLNVVKRSGCRVVGVCTTGLTETRGEDLAGDLKLIRARNPELAEVELVGVSTPDFSGAIETGWNRACTALVEQLVRPALKRDPARVAVLAGSHLTVADVEEIRDLVQGFGLVPTILPNLADSLDGHVPDRHLGMSYGGTEVEDIRRLGGVAHAIALGQQMRPAAEALHRAAGTPYTVIERLTGLEATDGLVALLQRLSGCPAPAWVRHRRSQLIDAMLDGHFPFGGARVAVAADPDLLFALTAFLAEMGAEVVAAVASCESPILARVPATRVVIGDLDDVETGARGGGADLLVTHSHGRTAAARLNVPLYRAGFPIFDRIGAQHRRTAGYRGTRDLIFAIANLLLEQGHEAHPGDWPLPDDGTVGEDGCHASFAAH